MTDEPYELLVRMPHRSSPGGASVRYITTVGDRDFESDPQPLAGDSDPAFAAFAAQFSATTLAERDEALAERDAAAAAKAAAETAQAETETALAAMTAERDALRLELDAIKNPVDNSGFPVLSAVQLRLGIVESGISVLKIEDTIDNIPDEKQRIRVRTYWEFATQFERHHPLILGMLQLLEMSESEADELWRKAGGI